MKRPIRIEGGLAYVPLTKGYEAVIDAADVPLVDNWGWHSHVTPRSVYAVRNDRSGSKLRLIRLHRVIMGDPDGLEIDHIDGDSLNNQRINLRVVTRSQNQQNARKRLDSKSNYKGVGWHKASQKWFAQIQFYGQRRHLGLFKCPTAAHFAYISASRHLHGEFGRSS